MQRRPLRPRSTIGSYSCSSIPLNLEIENATWFLNASLAVLHRQSAAQTQQGVGKCPHGHPAIGNLAGEEAEELSHKQRIPHGQLETPPRMVVERSRP
jgi:hypothetical protein